MAKIQCSIFSKNYNSYVIIKFMDGHDNDANKNAQNNSASRQGIFSTPELTVNAENIAQQNNEETKSRVASIFANTDAGKQAQKLNDAMDAQTVPATEDLVIQNGPKKKSRLPIVLLILALVAAGVGGLAWALMNNIHSTDTTVISIDDTKVPFYRYANYLISGDASDTKPLIFNDDYSNTKLVTTMLSTNLAERTSYLDSAEKLLNDFTKNSGAVSSTDNANADLLYGVTNNLSMQFNTIKMYFAKDNIESGDMMSLYISGGGSTMLGVVRAAYSNMLDGGNAILSQIASEKIAMSENISTFMNVYSGYGCIDGGGINEGCIEQIPGSQELFDAQENMRNEQVQIMSLYVQLFDNLFSGCENVLGVLEGTLNSSIEGAEVENE